MPIPATVKDSLSSVAALMRRLCLLIDCHQVGVAAEQEVWTQLKPGVLELVQALLPILKEIEQEEATAKAAPAPPPPAAKNAPAPTRRNGRRMVQDPYINQVVRWYSRGRLKVGRVVGLIPAGHPVPADMSQGRKMQCTAYSSQDRYLVEVYIDDKEGYGLYSLPVDRVKQCLVQEHEVVNE